MIGSQSRALLTRIFTCFQLNFESKNGPLGRRPGLGKDGQNNAKTPLFVTSPPEIPTENEKRFFQFWLENLLNP